MMGEQQNEVRAVFLEALALTVADERARYLDAACRDKPELRQRVEALLQAREQVGEFLKQDALGGNLDPLESSVAEVPGTVIGRYKLLEQIGEGGFGVVFMAEQVEPIRRRVALKIVKPGMDTKQVIARFEAERQALALMDHPNIAHVFDAGATDTGRPYFVMELVHGVPLTRFCDANSLPPRERLKLFLTVCEAVQHAHQKGIIHRDLKPSNILVTLHDGKPVPKVIDFGTAKALQQPLTEKTLFTAYGKLIGTPQYMSPEQAEMSGLDVDTRADIYSLGVLLYELLTGTTPFEMERLRAAAFEEMLRIIREEEPPKPSTRVSTLGMRATEIAGHRQVDPALLRRTLQGDLDWIVMKALEKDRARRYDTASALVDDIQHHINHEPVLASPPDRVYRARKFVRRHRLGVAFATAVMAALALGLVTSLIGFSQARHERDRALTAEGKTGQERNHAELLAAEAALAEGQSKLEAGDSWGLLDMVRAFDLAKHNPAFQETVGRRWSTWHAYWDRLTIAVRPAQGSHSPDHLQFTSVNNWPPNARGSAVYLYDTLSGAQLIGPLAHDSAAIASAFSPDGRLLATLTQEGVIHLWDRKTGAPVRPSCQTGIAGLEFLSFSPCGRFLVAFAGTETYRQSRVALIRLDQPQEPAHILDQPSPVHDARFSPDGELLAIWCYHNLQLWRTSDLQPVGSPLPIKSPPLFEFSPDGSRLVFSPLSSTGVGLLDTSSQKLIRIFPAVGRKYNARFSHDGRMLAWADWDGAVEIWDAQSGIRPSVAHGLGAKVSLYYFPAFNPDDSLLAAVTGDGRIHVLRTSNGEVVQVFHVPPYAYANFLTNGILVVSEEAKLVHFWDLAATPLPGGLLSDDALAHAVAFDNSGKFLATGREGELRLWLMQPSPTLERVVTLPGRVQALTFSEADGQFVVFTDEGTITLVDPETGNATARANCGRGYDLSASLSPDGRKLALFRWGELLAVNTQTATVQPINDEASGTLSVAFKPDSSAMLVGFAGWRTILYDATSKTNAVLKYTPFEGWVEDVAFHPDGNLFAANVGSIGLHLYDSKRRRDIGEIRKPSVSERVMGFSPDGSLLAVAGQTPNGGYAVELWHVDPQRGLFASGVSLPCDQPVWSVAFSPDNRTLVVGGLGTTRLWHLPPVPKDFQEIQARTWATLGFRRDDKGRTVYLDPPKAGNEEVRARITQAPVSSVPPLDAALKLPPAEALTALQQLADQHPGTKVYQKLLGRIHADCVASTADQGLWIEALAHADAAIRLGHDNPETRYQRALACLGAGDAAGYRATCRDMAARYKSSNDPDVIKWVALSAALAAGGLDDYGGIIEQMRRAAPRVSGLFGPGYRFYLGAVLLRDGQYQAATDEFEQADRHLKATGAGAFEDFSPIYSEFLLAICHAHLGNDAIARQWFDAAQVDVRNLLKPDQGETPTTSITSWDRRLTIRLLQEEAERLLNPSTPPSAPL
jgi:serine/threonine protein kinase/WD40 repeat protein/tetratricopeptide (TPR) repeat protein